MDITSLGSGVIMATINATHSNSINSVCCPQNINELSCLATIGESHDANAGTTTLGGVAHRNGLGTAEYNHQVPSIGDDVKKVRCRVVALQGIVVDHAMSKAGCGRTCLAAPAIPGHQVDSVVKTSIKFLM